MMETQFKQQQHMQTHSCQYQMQEDPTAEDNANLSAQALDLLRSRLLEIVPRQMIPLNQNSETETQSLSNTQKRGYDQNSMSLAKVYDLLNGSRQQSMDVQNEVEKGNSQREQVQLSIGHPQAQQNIKVDEQARNCLSRLNLDCFITNILKASESKKVNFPIQYVPATIDSQLYQGTNLTGNYGTIPGKEEQSLNTNQDKQIEGLGNTAQQESAMKQWGQNFSSILALSKNIIQTIQLDDQRQQNVIEKQIDNNIAYQTENLSQNSLPLPKKETQQLKLKQGLLQNKYQPTNTVVTGKEQQILKIQAIKKPSLTYTVPQIKKQPIFFNHSLIPPATNPAILPTSNPPVLSAANSDLIPANNHVIPPATNSVVLPPANKIPVQEAQNKPIGQTNQNSLDAKYQNYQALLNMYHKGSSAKKTNDPAIIQINSDEEEQETNKNQTIIQEKLNSTAISNKSFDNIQKSMNFQKLITPQSSRTHNSALNLSQSIVGVKTGRPHTNKVVNDKLIKQIKQKLKKSGSIKSALTDPTVIPSKPPTNPVIIPPTQISQKKELVANNDKDKASTNNGNAPSFMMRLKQKLKVIAKQQPPKKVQENKKVLQQKKPQQIKKDNFQANVKKYLEQFGQSKVQKKIIPVQIIENQSSKPVGVQQNMMFEVNFCVDIKLLHDKEVDIEKIKDYYKRQNQNSNISGPKNTITNTQKAFGQNNSPEINQTATHRLNLTNSQLQTTNGLASNKFKTTQAFKNPNYSIFLTRRALKQGRPIDLGVLSLDEVVQHCYHYKIISQELFAEFVTSSTINKIQQFLGLFTKGRLKEWDYSRIKITIMDHRRLCELLVRMFPKQFRICTPLSLHKQISLFLVNLYDLTSKQYKTMLNIMDGISKLKFWNTLALKYKHLDSIPVNVAQFEGKIASPRQPKPTPILKKAVTSKETGVGESYGAGMVRKATQKKTIG